MLRASRGTTLPSVRPGSSLPYAVGGLLSSPCTLFLVLALAIMWPLLRPGYILTLDSPIAINWDTEGYWWGVSDGAESVYAATYNSAPIATALKAFQLVLPDWVVQRLYLVLLFWLCGIGAYRLPFLSGPGRYYAGVLYAVNPFTYARFVAGQWGVLGAYALAPFALASFIDLLERPEPRKAVQTALLLTGLALMQVHGLAITLGLLALVYVAHGLWSGGGFRRTLPMAGLFLALFLGINAFWIARLVAAGGGVAAELGSEQMRYFAAKPPLDVVSMRGFWLAYEYLDIADLFAAWWLLFLPLPYLAVLGAVGLMRQPQCRWLGVALVCASCLSVFLAAAPALPVASAIPRLLWEHVPAYAAFRDSHKFVAVLALAYAYLGGLGLGAARESLAASRRDLLPAARALGLVMPVVPLLYTLPIFGTWGQLRPTDFPREWYEVRSILDADTEDYNVLVAPWQMYTDFSWLDNQWRRLANPAPGFFSQPTISGDNLEIGVVSSDSNNPVSRYVEAALDFAHTSEHFGALMAPLNVRYVVLLEAPDYRSYEFLASQKDMELVYGGETVSLFRNLSPTSRAYLVRDFSPAADWRLAPEAVRECTGQGDARCAGSADAATTASVTKLSPVSYRVEVNQPGYLLFTLPQHVARHGWRYDGQEGFLHLGMTPVFEAAPGTGTVTFARFYHFHLPTYVVSAASLLFAGVVYIRCRPPKETRA